MPKIKEHKKKNGEIVYKTQLYTGIHPLTGKESTTTLTKNTKTELKAEISRVQYEVKHGLYWEKSDLSKATFKEVYLIWREKYKNMIDEDSTLLKNDRMFKNRILPNFGKYLITEITIEQVQEVVNDEWGKYKSANKWLGETSRVFHYAQGRKIIQMNPCDFVTAPNSKKKKDKKRKHYRKEELIKLVKALDEWENKKARAFIRILLFTGLRYQETAALSKNVIDRDRNLIHVQNAIGRREKNDGSGKTELYLKGTKNTSSEDIVRVDEVTLEYLNEIETESEWYFLNENGNWLNNSRVNKWLKQITEIADIPYLSSHKLRHSHASILHETGATMKEIQLQLRHSDIAVTMDTYTHIHNEDKKNFADKMNDYLTT